MALGTERVRLGGAPGAARVDALTRVRRQRGPPRVPESLQGLDGILEKHIADDSGELSVKCSHMEKTIPF